MKLYCFDSSGFFTGTMTANKCQITGVDLIPAFATPIEPLKAKEGEYNIFNGEKWAIFIPDPPRKPTIEELRETMVIRADIAQLKLVKLGLFEKFDDAIMSLPRSTPMRILWEKAPDYRRLDPYLIEFLTEFGFDDEAIDKLFL